MKLVFIAHPVRGDVAGNLEKVKQLVRKASLYYSEITPIAPYYLYCNALDDNDEHEREFGMIQSRFVLTKCDELWLCGDRISKGMKEEIKTAKEYNIPIINMIKTENK
jgi:hypothetical protein